MKKFVFSMACVMQVSLSGLPAQDLMSAADVVKLPSPPADYVLSYGPDELQYGKLRLPDGSGPHPVVIFIHGGCWLSQYTISHTGLLEQALADAGYAVWSIEYRRVGDVGGGWPGTFQDVARGADYLRVLAPEHDLDVTKIIASGHSAGGHLALWLAARSNLSAGNVLAVENPIPIHGVLALAPAPDLESLHGDGVCGNVIDRLMGGAPDVYPNRYAAASPMQLAPVGVPQILVIGAYDRSWAPVGRRYYEHARATGDTLVQTVDAAASGHFEMIVPTTSTWPLVLTSLRELFDGLRVR